MDASPFGTLPPELRNRIYEYFFQAQLDRKTCVDIREDRGRLQRNQNNTRSALALTATCHQLRNETLAIFWSTASLRVVSDTLTAYSEPVNDVDGVHPMNRANHINHDRVDNLQHWLQHSGIADFSRCLQPIELDLGMWDPRHHAWANQHSVLRLLEGNTKSLTHMLQSIEDFASSTIDIEDQAATECTLIFKVQVQPSTALGRISIPNVRKQALAKISQLVETRAAGVQGKYDEGLLTPNGHLVLLSDLAMCRSLAELLIRYVVEEEKEEPVKIRSPAGKKKASHKFGRATRGRE